MIESVAYELIKQEGIEEGRKKGIQEGLQKGLKEGLLKARREDVLALLQARLNLTPTTLERIQTRLEAIDDLERLQELLIAAAQVESLAAFEEALG